MIVGSDKEKKKEEKEEGKDEEAMGALEQLLGGPQNEIRTIGLIGDVDEDDWPRGHLEDGISPNYALRLRQRREQNKPTSKQKYDSDDDLSGKYTVDYSDDKTLDALMYDEVTFDDGVSWI